MAEKTSCFTAPSFIDLTFSQRACLVQYAIGKKEVTNISMIDYLKVLVARANEQRRKKEISQ